MLGDECGRVGNVALKLFNQAVYFNTFSFHQIRNLDQALSSLQDLDFPSLFKVRFGEFSEFSLEIILLAS